jgi:1-phosphofructokinase family hexose kinase
VSTSPNGNFGPAAWLADGPHDLLVVGPNPAVDTYYTLESIGLGRVNRVSAVRDTAGGKANNLARAHRRLGGRPLVISIAAGRRGAFILDQLRQEGLDHDYVLAGGDSRLNTTVLSTATRETTVLLEPGQPAPAEALDGLAAKVDQWAPTTGWVALTGSLPQSSPPDLFARLTGRALAARAAVAVDAGGEVLRLAALAGPDLVKVNQDEFESAFPGQAHDWAALRKTYRDLAERGLKTLCLTAGARGAIFLQGEEAFGVRTDVAQCVSTVGAGDTFLAGLLVGLRRGDPLREAARLASAAAAANLQVLGCGFIELEAVHQFLERSRIVTVRDFWEAPL